MVLSAFNFTILKPPSLTFLPHRYKFRLNQRTVRNVNGNEVRNLNRVRTAKLIRINRVSAGKNPIQLNNRR